MKVLLDCRIELLQIKLHSIVKDFLKDSKSQLHLFSISAEEFVTLLYI